MIEFFGRIPGDFPHNSVVGYTDVDHEWGDPAPENDRVNCDINVTKIWEGVEEVTPYIHARFPDALTISDPATIDRDLGIGERLVTPIQVPVFYGAGVEKSFDPILH